MARTAPKPADSVKPKRGKKGSNVAPTEDAFRSQLEVANDYLKAAEEIRETLNTAMGRYRSSRKAVNTIGEGLGYKPSTIDFYLKAIRRDPDEVAEEEAQRARILAFMALPSGSQSDMFGAPLQSTSEFVEDSDEERAFLAGATAHVNGVPRGDCPSDTLADCWLLGWDRSVAEQTTHALDKANVPKPEPVA